MRYYKPKRDIWLALIFLSAPVVVVAAAWPLLQTGRLFSTVDGLLLLVVNAFVFGLLAWLWFGTGYALVGNELRVRCGPMHKQVPLDRIRYVRPGWSLQSAPALSLRRLHIGIQNGRLVDELPIAPADPQRFIAELQQRCPKLIVHGGGAMKRRMMGFVAVLSCVATVALMASATVSAMVPTTEFRSQLLELKLPDVTLRGTLEQPLTTEKVPVVLIVAGSGPTDRDGNSKLIPGANNSLKMVAQQLAAQGIASLRYDKRGIGESVWSQPDESKLRLDSFVNDADAWAAELERRGFAKPVLLGHSEGALLVTLLAQRRSAAGVVLIAGAGRPADVVIQEQLQKQAPQFLPDSARILAELKAGRLVADVPPALMGLYRPSVQPYMQSWLRRDPALELAKLKLPVMTISGDADIQVGTADADALAKVPSVASLRIANMNHVLKQVAPADLVAQQNSYNDPALPLAPELVPALVRFIRSLP